MRMVTTGNLHVLQDRRKYDIICYEVLAIEISLSSMGVVKSVLLFTLQFSSLQHIVYSLLYSLDRTRYEWVCGCHGYFLEYAQSRL